MDSADSIRQRFHPAFYDYRGRGPESVTGNAVQWVPTNTGLLQEAALCTVFGHRIGWTITGTDLSWDLSGVAIEYDAGREW